MMVPARGLETYRRALEGCRFCPMCKPAGEVANLTLLESHSTRARAMQIWRILEGTATWTPRHVELLYQSTLDGISEAWCVSHYPVSAYVAAARAEVFDAGLAPHAVRQALERPTPSGAARAADALLLAAEVAEFGDETAVQPALRLLDRTGVRAWPAVTQSGALAYALGDWTRARAQAEHVTAVIRESGAGLVVADGPRTLWALRGLLPALGVTLPDGVTVTSWSEHVARALGEGRLRAPRHAGTTVLAHDSRSAAFMAETLASAVAIQPGHRGPEETLGTGGVYDAPRQLIDATGAVRVFTVWSRALCRSCGADDGLWLTYPALAEGLARRQVAETRRLGADVIVTDSLLCARHLARWAHADGLPVRWLPEWLEEASSS
jgi:Fe-S oxidoreductase